MKKLFIVIVCLMAINATAQKKILVETKEEAEKLASSELETAMTGPEGALYVFGTENNIEGEYDFNITLGDKGKVVSLFVKGRKGGDISSQNKVKDAVKAFRFHFKLPKGKYYKFQYKFKF